VAGHIRQRLALYGVLFVMGADMFLVPMLIPAMASSFRTGVAQTAYIVAAFGAAYAISSPFVTGLLHSRSSRAVISGGLPIIFCACVIAMSAPNLVVVVLARTASGLGAAIVNPAVWSRLQVTAADQHTRGRVTLGGTAVSAAGQVVGIPSAALLAAHGGWRLAFVALAAAFAVTWIAILATVHDGATPGTPVHGGALNGLRLWRFPTFSLAVIGNVAAQAARLGMYSYIAVLLSDRYDVQSAALGIIGIVAGFGSLAGALVGTAIISWWCRRGWPVMGVSVVATLLMFVGAALMVTPVSLTANVIGLGVSFATGITVFGAGQFYLASTFVGDRTAVSWNSSAMYIGAAVGTLALGVTAPGSLAFAATGLAFVAIGCVSCAATVAVARSEPRYLRASPAATE